MSGMLLGSGIWSEEVGQWGHDLEGEFCFSSSSIIYVVVALLTFCMLGILRTSQICCLLSDSNLQDIFDNYRLKYDFSFLFLVIPLCMLFSFCNCLTVLGYSNLYFSSFFPPCFSVFFFVCERILII